MTEHEKMLITKYDLLFESRLSKVETAFLSLDNTMKELKTEIKEIKIEMKTDFKFYLYMYSAAILGLSGLMAKGFHWL